MQIDKKLDLAIEQLKQGEQQGFQILYDKTHNYVFMQARTLLKNEAVSLITLLPSKTPRFSLMYLMPPISIPSKTNF